MERSRLSQRGVALLTLRQHPSAFQKNSALPWSSSYVYVFGTFIQLRCFFPMLALAGHKTAGRLAVENSNIVVGVADFSM
eukprot:127196-Amphidinium_carterae.1